MTYWANHGMQRSGGGLVFGEINVNSRRPLIPDVPHLGSRISTVEMTTKKTLALIAVVAAYFGNAYAVRSDTGVYIPMIVGILSAFSLLATIAAISKNVLIAAASALWWLTVCASSLLLPLSLELADVWFDLGLGGFLCLMFGLLFGYFAFVLWSVLPWDPIAEETR